MNKKVAIFSHDNSHDHGFYNKIHGLMKVAKKRGLDYTYIDHAEDGCKYDVTINWDPFSDLAEGKKLTIVWEWDTYRIGKAADLANRKFHLLFRAHATFYRGHGIDPRLVPTYWMPPAVDPDVFKRDKEIEPEYDVVFVGTARAFPEFDILRNNFKTLVHEQKMGYPQYIETLNKGRLVLNAPVAHETNKRVMEAMAIGPALMSWGSDYTLLATPGEDFVCYKSMYGAAKETDQYQVDLNNYEKYLVEHVRSYLDNPKLLQRIQKSGRHLVMKQFTFDKQLDRIEEIIRHHMQ